MDLQKMIDAMGRISSQERSNYHLRLGDLVAALEAETDEFPVVYDFDEASPSAPESYRGYYSDLSFPPSPAPMTVGELLKEAKDAIGHTFEGYKGGDFEMDTDTPLWASPYGSSNGRAIMSVGKIGDRLVLSTKVID